MEKYYFVYILTNKRHGTLYTGVTSNLLQRVYEHNHGVVEGFSKKYGLHHLVYYEVHADVHEAICREKRIKRWRRPWKINLIEENNPQWMELASSLG